MDKVIDNEAIITNYITSTDVDIKMITQCLSISELIIHNELSP